MSRSLAPVFALFAGVALAQPVVTAIENNYSYIPPGLPNSGIAQGSIFVIFGSNLAATSSGLQGVPLKTVLDGVSVQFDVGGAVTQALLYYVMPNQIAGILPSATPTGTGSVTVTSGGQTSAPASLTVVQSAIGISTGPAIYGSQAIAYDAHWNPLAPDNAANPGDIVVLCGTGAGPVTGDESIQQTPQNLANIPIEIDIGGIPATVAYHGRSVYPGVDQFNVVVPAGAVGCYVSVAAVSGGIVSNFAYIPVAAGTHLCSQQVPGVTLGPSETVMGTNTLSTAILNFSNTVSSHPMVSLPGGMTIPAGIIRSGFGNGQFLRQNALVPGMQFEGQLGITDVIPSIGQCAVYPSGPAPQSQSTATTSPATPNRATPNRVIPAVSMPSQTPPISPLNAGPALNFTGPGGTASAPLLQAGLHSGSLWDTAVSSTGPQLIPAAGGAFTIDNGGGGSDVGAFSSQMNLPPQLVWSNLAAITSIDRSQPLSIAWTGGDPNGFVNIQGDAVVYPANSNQATASVQFNCTAPVSAQQFTIPPSVLLSLPPQPIPMANGFYSPYVYVWSTTNFLFTAPGLAGGIVSAQALTELFVPYL